jgi:lipopolysaccharide transport system permease protein
LKFRDLVLVLSSRDIKLRYRQTLLGVVWVLLQPLLATGILTFVFGTVAGIKSSGLPYPILCFAGMLAWTAFSSTLSKSSMSMVGNAALVSKVYFPRLILPLSTVGSTILDLAVSALPMIIVMVVWGIGLTWSLVLLPLWLGLLLIMSLGLGLGAAALTVSYRDVQHVLPVLIPFLMYASPVGFTVQNVPQAYLSIYFLANPMASLIEGFRWSLLGTAAPPVWAMVYSASVAISALLLGTAIFRRMERRFADVI